MTSPHIDWWACPWDSPRCVCICTCILARYAILTIHSTPPQRHFSLFFSGLHDFNIFTSSQFDPKPHPQAKTLSSAAVSSKAHTQLVAGCHATNNRWGHVDDTRIRWTTVCTKQTIDFSERTLCTMKRFERIFSGNTRWKCMRDLWNRAPKAF